MKKLILVMVIVLAAAFALAGCGNSDVIKITHKDYTEQRITGQLLAIYLESKGYETEISELSGTMLCYTALRNGDVDLYAEFTGSAYGAILDQTEILGVQETYDYVKSECEAQHGITWLTPLGWNNTYVFSVREDTQAETGVTTISELVEYAPEMIMGCDDEFLSRADGLPGVKEYYPGLEFKQEVPMDQGLTYAALKNGEIDVNVSYSTDGRIAKYNLKNIDDDKGFFPPYYVTPILRMEFADENPEVVEALLELGNQWTSEEMQIYNLMVDEGEDAGAVATMMLQEKGLID